MKSQSDFFTASQTWEIFLSDSMWNVIGVFHVIIAVFTFFPVIVVHKLLSLLSWQEVIFLNSNW